MDTYFEYIDHLKDCNKITNEVHSLLTDIYNVFQESDLPTTIWHFDVYLRSAAFIFNGGCNKQHNLDFRVNMVDPCVSVTYFNGLTQETWFENIEDVHNMPQRVLDIIPEF